MGVNTISVNNYSSSNRKVNHKVSNIASNANSKKNSSKKTPIQRASYSPEALKSLVSTVDVLSVLKNQVLKEKVSNLNF